MILADAGIVIAYLRGKDTRLIALADALPLAVCGVTRAEVLRGVRSPVERTDTVALLDSFFQVVTSEAIWDASGDNLAKLRAAGISVPFPDAILATLAIAEGVELWGRDKHFAAMSGHLIGMRIYAETP